MEEIVKQAFELSEYMTVLANQKNILKEEYNQNLIYFEFGGTFTLTKEFISYINLLLSNNQVHNVIIIDDNDTPICIENLNTFFQTIFSKYTEATNEYYTKYIQVVNTRKINKLIDLDE